MSLTNAASKRGRRSGRPRKLKWTPVLASEIPQMPPLYKTIGVASKKKYHEALAAAGVAKARAVFGDD